jgi:hypothetical protein
MIAHAFSRHLLAQVLRCSPAGQQTTRIWPRGFSGSYSKDDRGSQATGVYCHDMPKKKSADPPSCVRCGNIDDLGAVLGRRYCRACRTCPHGQCYVHTWDPPCWFCVRALHTLNTFEGPRILDLDEYIRDAEEHWGLGPADIVPYTFVEYSRAFNTWLTRREALDIPAIKEPPHFINKK